GGRRRAAPARRTARPSTGAIRGPRPLLGVWRPYRRSARAAHRGGRLRDRTRLGLETGSRNRLAASGRLVLVIAAGVLHREQPPANEVLVPGGEPLAAVRRRPQHTVVLADEIVVVSVAKDLVV